MVVRDGLANGRQNRRNTRAWPAALAKPPIGPFCYFASSRDRRAAAGVKAGLAPELAEQLATWTVAGAGELLHRSDLGPQLLRQNVTSPNGTTFAALQVLMAEGGLSRLMEEAVAAAAMRSRELAK